jgi:hypothetical protein
MFSFSFERGVFFVVIVPFIVAVMVIVFMVVIIVLIVFTVVFVHLLVLGFRSWRICGERFIIYSVLACSILVEGVGDLLAQGLAC